MSFFFMWLNFLSGVNFVEMTVKISKTQIVANIEQTSWPKSLELKKQELHCKRKNCCYRTEVLNSDKFYSLAYF